MSSPLEIKENPLDNPLILSAVFNFVSERPSSVDTLKSIRLVSKLWYSLVTSQWRAHAKLSIAMESWMRGISLPEYLDLEDLKKRPFLNLKLKSWRICASTDLQSLVFWNDIAPKLKTLHFDQCDIREQNMFTKILFETCPNLETLQLSNSSLSGFETGRRNENVRCLVISGQTILFVWETLLKALPNLEEIQLKRMRRLTGLIEGMREARLNLTHLDLMDSFDVLSTYDLERLTEPGSFSFKTLSISVSHEEPEEDILEALSALLRRYGETLIIFRVLRPPFKRLMRGDFDLGSGQLAHLEKVELWGAVVDNLNFLKACPKLKRLRVDVSCFEKEEFLMKHKTFESFYEWDDPMEEDNMVANTTTGEIFLDKVTTLQMDFPLSGTADLEKIGKWMPNLKELELIAKDNEMFSNICSIWQGTLERLRIKFGSKVDDDGITGYWLNAGYGLHPRMPGIRNLTNLRSFQQESFCDESKLTHHSVYNGFLELEHLTNLEICAAPSEMRRVTLEEFEERKCKVRVNRNFGKGHKFHYDSCCRRKRYKMKPMRLHVYVINRAASKIMAM